VVVIIISFLSSSSSSLLNSATIAYSSSHSSYAPSCITYTPYKRLISVMCGSVTLTQIYTQLKDESVLKTEGHTKKGVWLLNASLQIAKKFKNYY